MIQATFDQFCWLSQIVSCLFTFCPQLMWPMQCKQTADHAVNKQLTACTMVNCLFTFGLSLLDPCKQTAGKKGLLTLKNNFAVVFSRFLMPFVRLSAFDHYMTRLRSKHQLFSPKENQRFLLLDYNAWISISTLILVSIIIIMEWNRHKCVCLESSVCTVTQDQKCILHFHFHQMHNKKLWDQFSVFLKNCIFFSSKYFNNNNSFHSSWW